MTFALMITILAGERVYRWMERVFLTKDERGDRYVVHRIGYRFE